MSRIRFICNHTLSVLLTALFVGTIAACGGGGSTPPPPVVIDQKSVVVGDFDGDGRSDMAVASFRTSGSTPLEGEVEVFFQDPLRPGSFSLRRIFGVGTDPSHVAAADLDRDGLTDLVTANTNADSVSVLLNDPTRPGDFFPAVDFPCGPAPLAVAIGDLNRDGLPDIAVAVDDGIDILFQNPAAPGRFLSPVHLALAGGGGTFSVAIGDLDGDGIPDIAAAGLNDVQIFFQDPARAGSFFLPTRFTAGLQPNWVAIADINRDGLLDLAVANIGSSADGSGASISVLLQDPVTAGNFLPARNFAASNGARNLAVRDLDGDGFPDIVAASVVLDSPNPGVVSIFLQNSTAPGNFALAATKPNGFTPQSVGIGDLNGDNRPDIAIQDGPSILFQDPLHPGIFFNETVIEP